jgi:hypothetical protein
MAGSRQPELGAVARPARRLVLTAVDGLRASPVVRLRR